MGKMCVKFTGHVSFQQADFFALTLASRYFPDYSGNCSFLEDFNRLIQQLRCFSRYYPLNY